MFEGQFVVFRTRYIKKKKKKKKKKMKEKKNILFKGGLVFGAQI